MTTPLDTDEPTTSAPTPDRYLEPGWFTRNVFNRLVRRLTRMGLSVWGSRELRVRGRSSGTWRSVPVNVLDIGDRRFLVAARGQTQWVKNLRASGHGELHVGRRKETFRSVELANDAKEEVLRSYLERWKFEVGAFFDGVDAESPSSEFARIATDHPVFEITVG